ncbi:MAG TPA: acireductone synthase [Woeseiaceae bacterium]
MKLVRTVVCDIEGTTSSLDFVHHVLFPYSARALPAFIRAHGDAPDIAPLLTGVRQEAGEPSATRERVIEILLGWIAEDRKATPLKALQGLVWERGYRAGDFTGHVYEDTAPAFRRWRAQGATLCIYSSGSVHAQQLLFGHSDAGDLRPLIEHWFDTRIGAKRDPESYRRIAVTVGRPADTILFLSDTAAELDAAAEAGLRTVQVARGERTGGGRHPVVRGFEEVTI